MNENGSSAEVIELLRCLRICREALELIKEESTEENIINVASGCLMEIDE